MHEIMLGYSSQPQTSPKPGLLTQMVNNVRLAPLGPARPGLFGAVADASVEQQVVDLGPSQLRQRPLGKRLDTLEVQQVEREDAHGVRRGVILDGVVGRLRGGGVPGAEDDPVGLGLLEELLDGFEALPWLVDCREQDGG